MSVHLPLHKWLCYNKSQSVGHIKRLLGSVDVGCGATLKTWGFQLLFKSSYIITELGSSVTAHNG